MSYTTQFEVSLGDHSEASAHVLYLQVATEGLQLLVINQQKQPLFFQRVEFDKDSVENGSIAPLAEWLSEQREWTRKWGKMVIVHDCRQVVLVPAALYNVDNGKELLDLQFGDLFKGTLLTEQVVGRQDYSVYRISTEAFHHLSSANLITQHRHLISLWLSWLEKLPIAEHGQAFMMFESSHVYLALRKEDWLLVQQYEYQQPEDISYYLLSALDQTGIPPEKLQLYINGWIDTDSSLYAELFKYILDIRIAPVPDGMQLIESSLEGQPAHYFTPLMQMASCAS